MRYVNADEGPPTARFRLVSDPAFTIPNNLAEDAGTRIGKICYA